MLEHSSDNTFGFLLTDTSRLFRQFFERTVQENGLGLTPGEIRALGYAIRFQGSRQAVLAERMGIEPMTLSAYLDRLEQRGLVMRVPDPSDRRAKLIEPTDEGLRTRDELAPLFHKVYAQVVEGIAPQDVCAMVDVMTRIRDKLVTDAGTARGTAAPDETADADPA